VIIGRERMRRQDFKELQYFSFEKIRKKGKKRSYREEKDSEYKSQIFGSIHNVHDSKVKFDDNGRDYKDASRPGVVVKSPFDDKNFETYWAPGTSKIYGRNKKRVVIIQAGASNLRKTTAFLINYIQAFHPKTLGVRIGKFDFNKQEELRNKLRAINFEY
jgi:mRNA-degrading endonuclease toxin of MazEF toxin-antitoxin module